MAVKTETRIDINDAIEYLKRISPPQEGKEIPWFTTIHRDGLVPLWEAVRRLEEMAYNKQSRDDVGGPVIIGFVPGQEIMATKNPPPGPPPPLHGGPHGPRGNR